MSLEELLSLILPQPELPPAYCLFVMLLVSGTVPYMPGSGWKGTLVHLFWLTDKLLVRYQFIISG